jgi:hypothetical protein
VVEGAAVVAVEAEAMNKTGFEVAEEELLGDGVVGDGAEPGPALSLPSCSILANNEIKPVTPSIFHTEPGVPPLSRPNWPGIQRAPGSPLTRRSPLAATICKPNSEVEVT